MKTIALHGHERSITRIRYNREGDLIFSCAKDPTPNVWYAINGERLGTYGGGDGEKHSGALWCLDVDWQTRLLTTGGADNTLRLWDVSTGKHLNVLKTKSVVKTCNFSYSGNLIFFTTDRLMGEPCIMYVVDTRIFNLDDAIFKKEIPSNGPKVSSNAWGTLDQQVLSGHDNGDLVQWDLRTSSKTKIVSDHNKTITDMQLNSDGTMFICSSADKTAKVFDTDSLECIKTFTSDRPLNSASISPKFDHIVLGGGQDARLVTQTASQEGKFHAQFYHLVLEEEFAKVKDHFGPINSLQFAPDGLSYASGSEDGYVKLHVFEKSYLDFKFDY